MPELAMVALTISLVAGIVCASYLSLGTCAIIAGIGCILFCIISRKLPRVTIFIITAVFMVGAIRLTINQQVAVNDISHYLRSVSAYEGIISSDPELRTDRIRYIFRVDRALIGKRSEKVSGNVMVTQYLDKNKRLPNIGYGDRARITAIPYSPFEPTNPGQFSWGDYLARQGIYACVSIKRSDQIKMLRVKQGNVVVSSALEVKRYIVNKIHRIYPKEEASVIAGMVLGTYSYLPSDTFKNFTLSGTLHILAASGFNCYLLLAFATLLLFHILPKWRNVVILFLIGAYLLIVGPKPSLVRATIMASLLLLAIPLKRVPNARNIFFASAFIALMFNPSDIFDAGFQLSYLAVWALICVVPILESIFFRAGLMGDFTTSRRSLLANISAKVTGMVSAAGVSTVAISLVTAPIVAYYFNYISLVSIPANMALALGVPVVFVVGLISPVASHIVFLCPIVKLVGTVFTRFILNTINYFGSMSHSAVSVSSPAIPAIIGYYLLLYALLNYTESRIAKR